MIKTIRTIPFSGPVRGRDQNRVAHGGVCHIQERSRDGYHRRVNANAGQVETGEWYAPEGHPDAEEYTERRARLDRARLEGAVDRARAARPEPIMVRTRGGDGWPRECRAVIADDGIIDICGAAPHPTMDQIRAADPGFARAAVSLRQAILALEAVS